MYDFYGALQKMYFKSKHNSVIKVLLIVSILEFMTGCSRKPVLSLTEDQSRLVKMREFFSTAQITSVSILLSADEEMVCVVYPSGMVTGAVPSDSVRKQLLTMNASWLSSDSYWTLAMFGSKSNKLVEAFGIERSLVSDVSFNPNGICFQSDATVEIHSQPEQSYPLLTTFKGKSQ